MRDDWTRKNTIPNKSNEFIQQEASFWPAIYTLLGVKSMAISAVNTCFWWVKSRKQGCMTALDTHKQLCMSEIRKLLVLDVFTLQDGLVVYTPKIKRQGVKKNSLARPNKHFVEAHLHEISLGHFLHTFWILRSTRMSSHLAEKRKPKSIFAALGYFWPLLFR